MPQSLINLYNFYFRYPWDETAFAGLQTGLVDSFRGGFDAITGGAVTNGLIVSRVSGFQIQVTSGTAIAPDGSLLYLSATATLTLLQPASNSERSLIVIRPKLIDNTLVTKPTDPNTQVPLKTQQTCEIVVVRGTASATPVYPSKSTNDVVLAGVRVQLAGGLDANYDFDYSVREVWGKNRPGQHHDHSLYDNRLRPMRTDPCKVTIRPSISGYNGTSGLPSAISFTNIDQQVISKFPRDISGNFNYADTIVDFLAGTITGGDALSPDFTPATVSAANRYRVGLIQISTGDLLNIKFNGSDSTTKSAAYGLVYDRTVSPDPGYKLICYFILYSQAGTVWQDIDVIDARHPGNVVQSGAFGSQNISTTGTISAGTVTGNAFTSVTLPSTGATPTALTFYAVSTVATTWRGSGGSGSLSSSVNYVITRIGNKVSIRVDAVTNAGTAGGDLQIVSTVNLPSWARPTVTAIYGTGGRLIVSGAYVSAPLIWTVTQSAGNIIIARDGLTTAFPNASNHGWDAFCIEYSI